MVETEKRKYTVVLMVDEGEGDEEKILYEITQALIFHGLDVNTVISEQEDSETIWE